MVEEVYRETIECQFDSFCKIVARNEARNIYAYQKRQKNRFVSFEELSQSQLNQLSIEDTYETELFHFIVEDYDVPIENASLAHALTKLNERQLNIVLLSFFLNMNDTDIGKLMNLHKSTIHFHRNKALKILKEFMEEK